MWLQVAHQLAQSQQFEQLLIDTQYMSFVVFRKPYQAPDMIWNNLPVTSPTPQSVDGQSCGLGEGSLANKALRHTIDTQRKVIRELNVKLETKARSNMILVQEQEP